MNEWSLNQVICFFFIRGFCGKITKVIEKKKMEKMKARKEVSVELFIVEQEE